MPTIKTFPTLKTPRLLLARLRWTDIPKIVEYAGVAEIAINTLSIPHPYCDEDAIFWLNMAYQGFRKGTSYVFGIRLRETDEFVGGMGIHIRGQGRAELGYWIAKPFWNKGMATEAARVIIRFGFEELKLHKLYAVYHTSNPASGRVMQKNGMIREGLLLDHYKKGEVYHSVVHYRLLASEYEEMKEKQA